MLDFGRDVCSDLGQAAGREWLVTNGIGGYASGSVSGALTRRYHGLLVAALDPPLERTLLLSKLDETATYDGRTYPLHTNLWRDNHVEPEGYVYLNRFHLEGMVPVWTFAMADAIIEKRIWMAEDENTTFIHYRVVRALEPFDLQIKAFANCRGFTGSTFPDGWNPSISPVERGLRIQANEGSPAGYLFTTRGEIEQTSEWYRNFYLPVEDARGEDPYDHHLHVATIRLRLEEGQSVAVVGSTNEHASLDAGNTYQRGQRKARALLEQAGGVEAPAWVRRLVLAGDQFIVRRPVPEDPEGRTILAGYHWFQDWGRDTMISLAGLTLVTKQYDIARHILRTYAHFVDQGMLPNRFPEYADTPEYDTADAPPWYFEAIRAYHQATGDNEMLAELYPTLESIIDWHVRGTRHNIRFDQDDGLLYAGAEGTKLTWMDAYYEGWAVTPRIGKPVEINALWYNALRSMSRFAQQLGKPRGHYDDLAGRLLAGFERFWNPELGYCFDVLDGPEGNATHLRPNQIFAVSLPHSPLAEDRQKAVVDICALRLLTPHGLRSLAPRDPEYIGYYRGDLRARDGAYHQGTTWGWLIGPFISAHLRVYRDPKLASTFLFPLIQHLDGHGVGSISEIFDGEPPFRPGGCIAQAWSVAEMLRAWHEIETVKRE
jgi:predicted glycogen debranching enzyme